jgi:lipopolysaccharide/colanic/teichoic acid biosynthesis glycosyltransferase
VLAAGAGLLLLSPVFAVIAVLIRLSSPGPVFFRGERTGRHGHPFRIIKFRTMREDAAAVGAGITAANDPRVTGVGRLLRRTKLDELPQLINVLRGEMSLVGPRPEDPRYVALYTAEQRRVLRVRPGITSPASFQFRDEEALLSGADWERKYREEVMPQKLRIDLAYVENAGFWTDLALIWRTAATVVMPRRSAALRHD